MHRESFPETSCEQAPRPYRRSLYGRGANHRETRLPRHGGRSRVVRPRARHRLDCDSARADTVRHRASHVTAIRRRAGRDERRIPDDDSEWTRLLWPAPIQPVGLDHPSKITGAAEVTAPDVPPHVRSRPISGAGNPLEHEVPHRPRVGDPFYDLETFTVSHEDSRRSFGLGPSRGWRSMAKTCRSIRAEMVS